MTESGVRHSRSFARAALCAAFALTACSTGGGGASAVPSGFEGTSPLGRGVAGDDAASAVAYWAIVGSDYCPSKKETIQIQIVAANSQGALITGKYSPAFTLRDTDTSGATKLSATKVGTANQTVKLTYSGKSIGAFQIRATVGKSTAYATITPGGSCINSKPLVIIARDGAAGTTFTLSGASGHYKIQSPSSGTGCGPDVTVKRTSATQFVLASATTAYGYCYVQAYSKALEWNISVMIVTK
jgi:hypothetical protein